MAGAGAAADRRSGGHEMSEKPGAKIDTWREGRKTKGSRIRERPKRRAVVRLVRHETPQQVSVAGGRWPVAGSLYPSPLPTTRLLFGPSTFSRVIILFLDAEASRGPLIRATGCYRMG